MKGKFNIEANASNQFLKLKITGRIIDAAADLEETLKDDNATKEQIEEKLKVLTEKSHKLAEAMYKKDVLS